MKKVFNLISTNKYFSLLMCVILIYSLVFVLSPFNQRIGDFILDSNIIESYKENGLSFSTLFKNESFYGCFLSNVLSIVNYVAFDYSSVAIKIENYLLNIGIIILTYIFMKPKNDSKNNIGLYFVFSLLFIDFFGCFQTASMNNIKMMMFINLLSFVLYREALKVNGNKKLIFIGLASSLQLFAFYMPSIIVYLYLIYKKHGDWKCGLLTIVMYILCFSLNSELMNNISAGGFNTRVLYAFSSAIAPINRIQATEYVIWLYITCAVFVGLAIVISMYSNNKRNNYDEKCTQIVLIFNLILSVLFFTKETYYYTSIGILNSYVFAYLFYFLTEVYLERRPEKEAEIAYMSKEKFVSALTIALVFISTGFGISFIAMNKDLYHNGITELNQAIVYDHGRVIDSDLNYVFETTKDDMLDKYEFSSENGLIKSLSYEKIISDTEMNSKDTVKYIRNVRQDSLKEYWLRSNFAFEIYVSDYFFKMDLYSPLESNRLELYVNNHYIGERNMSLGDNNLYFNLGDYLGQNVIVYGFFDEEYKGPLDREGFWSCEIMNLSFGKEFGYYELEDSGTRWTKTYFGDYYNKVTSSYMYTFYIPDDARSNEISVYVNNQKQSVYTIYPGLTDVCVDLTDYIGKSALVTFSLEHKLETDADTRELGAILSKISKYTALRTFEQEIEITRPYLKLKFDKSIYHQNFIEIYIDDKYYGMVDLDYSDSLTIKTGDYLGKTITIKEIYQVGVNKSCLNEYEFTTHYGLYETDESGSNWTADRFGFYLENVYKSKSLRMYVIESLADNRCVISVNGERLTSIVLASGINDVELDLSEYVGQNVYVDITLEKYQDASVDGRVLGVILSNLWEVE